MDKIAEGRVEREAAKKTEQQAKERVEEAVRARAVRLAKEKVEGGRGNNGVPGEGKMREGGECVT